MTEITPSFTPDHKADWGDEPTSNKEAEQARRADQADLEALEDERKPLAEAARKEVYPEPTDGYREDVPTGDGSYRSNLDKLDIPDPRLGPVDD